MNNQINNLERLSNIIDLNWVWLAIGIALEVAWVLTLKATEGYSNLKVSIISTAIVAVNLYIISQAFRTLPTATSYAIYTGASVVGVAVCALILHQEEFSLFKAVCIALVVLGIIGLKAAAPN